MTIQQALQYGAQQLENKSSSHFLDAELLLATVKQCSKENLISRHLEELSSAEQEQYQRLISKRAQGKPLAYLTHEREFYGRSFYIDERVLVPRPETEQIIDIVKQSDLSIQNVIDVGTGSGCIAVTLAIELPNARVVATDISSDAIAIAKKNAELLHTQIDFRVGSLFDVLTKQERNSFDCIVSNPPYVHGSHIQSRTPDTIGLQYEPPVALDPTIATGVDDDFVVIYTLLEQAQMWLTTPGLLIIEIGEAHGQKAMETAAHFYSETDIQLQQDHFGKDRFIVIHT